MVQVVLRRAYLVDVVELRDFELTLVQYTAGRRDTRHVRHLLVVKHLSRQAPFRGDERVAACAFLSRLGLPVVLGQGSRGRVERFEREHVVCESGQAAAERQDARDSGR